MRKVFKLTRIARVFTQPVGASKEPKTGRNPIRNHDRHPMFPLNQKQLPANAEELKTALEAALRRFLVAPGDIVSIREKVYPDLAEIAVNLNDAKVNMNGRPPFSPVEKGRPAINAERLTITAQPISLGSASMNLAMQARDVVLHQSREKNGNLVLLLHRASDGEIAISVKPKDLESLISQIAKNEAGKQGVTIEDVRLALTICGPRSLRTEVRLRARKLFVRATIRIGGKVEIDEQLVARIRDLTCTGEGAIASLACNILSSHLRKLDGRNFELMALPLGEVQLRDVRLELNDAIKLHAEFGSRQAERRA